jgi:hypothetical protein
VCANQLIQKGGGNTGDLFVNLGELVGRRFA